MEKYKFKQIEKKWHSELELNKLFKAKSEKNKWLLFDLVNPGNVVRTFMRYEWEY